MPKPPRYQGRIELLQGTLDLLILQTLAWGPRHAYAIAQAIVAGSGQRRRAETGSLYPALHRFERQGWITARWERTENKQRAKVYRLTPRGRRSLAGQRSRWAEIAAGIAGVLRGRSEEI